MADAKKKIAVVLSGCGVFDGTEIHETVCTLLAIDRLGADYVCFAPNIPQAHVIDHVSGEETDETRNVLTESARIARGVIQDLAAFDADGVDAVIFPGGFGAAKNLSTFAFDGPACTVNADVERCVRHMVAAGKPIGALCVTPAVIAKILDGAEVTIGQDPATADAIVAMGGKHTKADHADIVFDAQYNLITSPCYMLDATISQIADGATNTVEAILDLVK